MTDYISALVGYLPINEKKVREYGLAVSFEGDCAVVILDGESMFYWGMKLHLSWYSEEDNRYLKHDSDLVLHFAKDIGFNRFAIVEINSDYDSFYGSFYIDNKPILIDESGCQALSMLGVKSDDGLDEFYQLNLDKYRDTEWCYSEYGRTWPWHTKRIRGFVPKD